MMSNSLELLRRLHDAKEQWAYLPVSKKLELITCIQNRCGDWGVTEQLAMAHVKARKMDPDASSHASSLASLVGMVSAIMLSGQCAAIAEGLQSLEKTGDTPRPETFSTPSASPAPQGVLVYDGGKDALTGAREIVMAREEGKAEFYKKVLEAQSMPVDKRPALGSVCVVLGAGNQAFLAASDTLHHLFVEGSVCLLKLHPLQAGGKEALCSIFEPLIAAGFLAIVEADMPTTAAMVNSEITDKVHLTGGIHTHDALVWGPDPEEQARNKKNNTPVLKAKMFSELGAITPYIVMPSADGTANEWDDKAIEIYASLAAVGVTDNNSCNCLACKVLVVPSDPRYDALTEKFVSRFREKLGQHKLEPAWYPGMEQRYKAWVDAVKASGESGSLDIYDEAPRHDVGNIPGHDVVLPIAVAEFKSPEDVKDKSIFRNEPFAPVVTIIRVPGSSLSEYADNVSKFATEQLWGNLSCAVFAPKSAESLVIDKVVAGDLLYGTVVLNGFTGQGYSAQNGVWGGVGNTLEDAQSGIGYIHNSKYMFDQPRNSLVWVPWMKAAVIPSEMRFPRLLGKLLTRVIVLGWRAVLPQFLLKRTCTV